MLLREIFQKISKTAAAYLVGGIAIIQLAPVFFNTFPPEKFLGLTEETIMQSLFVLVALGFPIALCIAYFYGTSKNSNEKVDDKQLTASGDYKQKIAVIPFEVKLINCVLGLDSRALIHISFAISQTLFLKAKLITFLVAVGLSAIAI